MNTIKNNEYTSEYTYEYTYRYIYNHIYLFHTIHAARNDTARDTPNDAKQESNNPSSGAWLRGCPSGDHLLTAGTLNSHSMRAKHWGCNILDLGDHLGWGLHVRWTFWGKWCIYLT